MTETDPYKEFLDQLIQSLTPHYTPPFTPGGYDLNHIREMLRLGPQIAAISRYSNLDLREFEVAVWLHNTDRPNIFREMFEVGQPGWKSMWEGWLYGELASCRVFDQHAKQRIIDAVVQHSKRNDEDDDSVLLTSLRIADKVVRFGPLGMMGQPANRGRDCMFYDPENPFSYLTEDDGATKESRIHYVLTDYFRVLEWYAMLPCDEARALINPVYLTIQLTYLIGLGRQIAEVTGKEDQMYECLHKALGPYADQVGASHRR